MLRLFFHRGNILFQSSFVLEENCFLICYEHISKYKMSELSCGNLTFIKGMDAVFFASQRKKYRHFNRMELKKIACKETITLDF